MKMPSMREGFWSGLPMKVYPGEEFGSGLHNLKESTRQWSESKRFRASVACFLLRDRESRFWLKSPDRKVKVMPWAVFSSFSLRLSLLNVPAL